jgi:hypothetical protein
MKLHKPSLRPLHLRPSTRDLESKLMSEPETNTEPPAKPPTAMELRFLDEYVANGENGGAAYQILHPNATAFTARVEASKTLRKPNIEPHLQAAREAFREANRPAYHRVLQEWAKIAYSDLGQILDFSKNPPTLRKHIPAGARQAIQSMTITPIEAPPPKKGKRRGKQKFKIDVKMKSSVVALDKISQHLGVYEPMPPLERLLSGLPEQLADFIREYLREQLLAQGRDPALIPARVVTVANAYGSPGDPDAGGDVPGVGADPRPVASKIPRELYDAPDGPRVSSGGEDFGGGGEDVTPLFE